MDLWRAILRPIAGQAECRPTLAPLDVTLSAPGILVKRMVATGFKSNN